MGAAARMIAMGFAWVGGAKLLGDAADLGQALFGSSEDSASSITWTQAAGLGAAAFGVWSAYKRFL